jgi:SAM-dependent methyltransferase
MNPDCASEFPVIAHVPVLINEHNSAFRINDFQQENPTYYAQNSFPDTRTRTHAFPGLRKRMPLPPEYITARNVFAKLKQLIIQRGKHAQVLILGGGIMGCELRTIIETPEFECIETDVAIGPRTQLVVDAHDIPFADSTFDCVIAQAVLEHVADPYRCVSEIHRVLKPDGIVFAGTPFLQPVHGGVYDFTRFTYRGHRRLFRNFKELESGAGGGPGYVLAFAYQHFMDQLFRNRGLRCMANTFARATSFWMKYVDFLLLKSPGAYDSASSFYFIGQRSEQILSDRALTKEYPAHPPL